MHKPPVSVRPACIETPSGRDARAPEKQLGRLLLIEIGIIVAGELDAIDRAAVESAVDSTKQSLASRFGSGGLEFRFETVHRSELLSGNRAEPSQLLRQAQSERDMKHWDFAFVVVAAELLGKYSSESCYAALSRPLDAAVFSTSLIDPKVSGESNASEERIGRISSRLTVLMLHALGHLTGLPQSEEPTDLMYHPNSVSDLDGMIEIGDDRRDRQLAAFAEIADQRLEESHLYSGGSVGFALRAAWINRQEIWEALWAARPWQFPRRLSGLTIASVSTLLVLMMTAEAWDLALSQSILSVVSLTVLVAIATTLFVAVRQQLLIRRHRVQSEQNVVTSVSAIAIVMIGMATTWAALVALGLTVAMLLFSSDLIAGWAASSEMSSVEAGFGCRLLMSCFSSTLGILIGALGASFESQNYFQHVIFVDEEL